MKDYRQAYFGGSGNNRSSYQTPSQTGSGDYSRTNSDYNSTPSYSANKNKYSIH